MKRNIFVLFFIFSILQVSQLFSADYHVIVKTERTYMDFTRESQTEYWFCEDKICIKHSRQTTIIREDLGLYWNIFGKNYYENKIESDEKKEEKTEKKTDIHTLGYDRYSPDYDWKIDETSTEKVINGYQTKFYEADGDADFAEVQTELWICNGANIKGSSLFNDQMIKEYQSNKQRKIIAKILEKNKNSFPVEINETIVNSIAPNMINKVQLIKFEEVEAPENIYELPEGLEKRK